MLHSPDRRSKDRASVFDGQADLQMRLRQVGLRPTRQRMAIGCLLFQSSRNRHVTVDGLFQEALAAGEQLSLATIYNTLHHFSDAGLIRRICTGNERVYFDTDTGDHHHFYIEKDGCVIDVPSGKAHVDQLPLPPPGYEISKVDVVIHLRAVEPPVAGCPQYGHCEDCLACERLNAALCQTAGLNSAIGDME